MAKRVQLKSPCDEICDTASDIDSLSSASAELNGDGDALNGIRLIAKRALAQLLGVSPWTIDRWRASGTFPDPVWVSDDTPRWRIADILAWLKTRQAHDAPKPHHSKQRAVRRAGAAR